jgi:hypothetical protein
VPKQYAYLHMVINEKWQGIPMKNVGGIAITIIVMIPEIFYHVT